MNLPQLRYICEIVRCGLNISSAAKALGASQPGVSQQVRLLEEELGVRIFIRNRNRLIGVTPKGEALIESAQRVLADIEQLETVAEGSTPTKVIRVVSSHVQARYALPGAIRRFQLKHPQIEVRITHRYEEGGGFWRMVQNGESDFAITTDVKALPSTLLALPCFPMRRSLIAPRKHPLLRETTVTLEAISRYPLITHAERSIGRRRILGAFAELGYTPKVVVSAIDEDVIKACVEEGMGVTILASIVYDGIRDKKLGAVDVTPLFEPSVTYVIVRRSMVRHEYVSSFIEAFAPKWSRRHIESEAAEFKPRQD